MFKLMHKKLNKKGFTMAELLVVVAVVVILVAIAVPIFINAMEEAYLRTYQANIRATKAAAVNHILTNWNEKTHKTSSSNECYRDGAKADAGWKAVGTVDAAGNLTDVQVTVVSSSFDPDIYGVDKSANPASPPKMDDDDLRAFRPESSTSGYYTIVSISDTDVK